MRVAALYDIHGNFPALNAVLEEVRQDGVDLVVVGGDVLPGPMPRETLERLRSIEFPVEYICGNGEVAVLEQRAGKTPPGVPGAFLPIIRWNAEQIEDEGAHAIARWPKTFRKQIDGLGEVLFCHATPRDENEIFTVLTPEERILPAFHGVNASLVTCGHTHMQFDRAIGGLRVVNAGSVGMPFGEPGAEWLLLGPTVQFRHTKYDYAKAAEQIRATKYPQAEEFAERNVLRPPSAEQMLKVFSGAR